MKHPFTVGGQFKNNHGDYVVQSINGDEMVIVYDDGQVQRNSVALMRRVWERLERERTSPPVEERTRRPESSALRFEGLADSDFKDNVSGTHWRARTQLGGALTHRLTDRSARAFESHAIFRRPEIHIVTPERYDPSLKARQAKFVFRLYPQMARYGLYVEKSSEPMDETWDWHRFRQAIGERPWQEVLERVLQSTGMTFDAIGWDNWVDTCVLRLTADAAGLRQSIPVDSATTWDAVLSFLDGYPSGEWLDVCIGAQSATVDVLANGAGIAAIVCDIYEPLIPLYDAITSKVVRIRK